MQYLNKTQRDAINAIVDKLKADHRGMENAIKAKDLMSFLQPIKIVSADSEIRKHISFIRKNNLCDGLLSTAKGYYIAKEPGEILEFVEGLKLQRESLDNNIKIALEYYEKISA